MSVSYGIVAREIVATTKLGGLALVEKSQITILDNLAG